MVVELESDNWKLYEGGDIHPQQRYLISKNGEVKSFHKGANQPTPIKGSINNNYRVITVRLKNGKNTLKYVHNIMCELFLPNPENKKFVVHLNHKKLDNRLSNLKWVSHEEWKEHNYDKFRAAKGSGHLWQRRNKLTKTQVIRLKKKLLDPNRKTRISMIAKEFGISESYAYRVKRGDFWGHIKVKI